MEKIVSFALLVVLALVISVCVGALLAVPTMLLINAIFPAENVAAVFGGPISFLQAWGLNFLTALLFAHTSAPKKD